MPWTGRLSQGRSAEGPSRADHGHSPSDGSTLRRSHNSRMSQALANSSGSSSLSIHLPPSGSGSSSSSQTHSSMQPGTPPLQSSEFGHANAAHGVQHSPRSANVPLTPSSIHPSYGVEHAKHAKYISNAYRGSSPQHQHQQQASLGSGSPPLSAPANIPNFPFDESRLHSYKWQNESDSRPLTQSPRMLSPRMPSHSPYADNKDSNKQRSCSLPKHSPHLRTAAEHQRRQPQAYLGGFVPAGSPLASWIDSLSSPGSNRLLDSPAAWIFYYFVLNLGLTLCTSPPGPPEFFRSQ